ncbi:MAG: hypothetical protein MK137_04010 [Rickettsiales bacterium]|nr:hypothetical protein [Rickettsiales bacterium]
MDNQTLEKVIKQAVKEGIEETLTTYGFDTENPREQQADQIHLRKIRKGSQDINLFVKRSGIWATVCTGAYLAFEGIKAYIKQLGG